MLVGDRRSGLQLLRDAVADSMLGIEDLAGSAAGRAKLDTLAATVEEWAGEVERRASEAAADRSKGWSSDAAR